MNLSGKIYNINSQEYIENVNIFVGNQQVKTNKNGEYFLQNLNTKDSYFLKIEHPDFVSILRKLKFNIAKDVVLNILIIPRNKEQKFNSSERIVAKSEGGLKIEVEPNSFVKNDGSLYKGEVLIRSTFINPKNNNDIIASPSTFISSDNTPLQSFGMVEIYATSLKGEKLNIKKENPIKTTIPNISKVEKNVGLYSLNTKDGSWIKKGEFIYNQKENVLIGEVTSISSAWNADNPCSNTLVCVKVQVVDNANNPKPWYFIAAKGLSYNGYSGFQQTDANGYVSLNVCPNSVFKFVGDIIPCCNGQIPGTPEHTACCINSGQTQGSTIDMNTVTLTPPCTLLGKVIMMP